MTHPGPTRPPVRFGPQTDLVLPGSLPLVFGRTFESSYRSGRWFGPTWASTVDQRLEIDAEGVILVQPDGSLLEYPHPEPAGTPALPTLSRRLPMTRDADGWYTVTDRASSATSRTTVSSRRCFAGTAGQLPDAALVTFPAMTAAAARSMPTSRRSRSTAEYSRRPERPNRRAGHG